MLHHRSTIVLLLCTFSIPTSLLAEDITCKSTLSIVRDLLNKESGNACATTCQGRPGKKGAVGLQGPKGPPGRKGPAGDCKCDLSIVKNLQRRIEELEEFQRLVSKKSAFCYAGISTGEIPISSITASSTHGTCKLSNIRLNSKAAWCAGTNDGKQWVQIDLKSSRSISGIATLGRIDCCNQFVKSYSVSYGDSVSSLTQYKEKGSLKIFTGNSDTTTIVKNYFLEPITARYIRIHPAGYKNWRSMRIELLDC